MWTKCTDSPNVMRALRRKLLESDLFSFAYGCAPHALNNLVNDVIKLPKPKKVLSMNVFTVSKVNAVHLLRSAYDVICREKFNGKTYSLFLFTKSRWSSC
ncbi:BED-type domain-containing protein [Plasmodiophora brassicae]